MPFGCIFLMGVPFMVGQGSLESFPKRSLCRVNGSFYPLAYAANSQLHTAELSFKSPCGSPPHRAPSGGG